ncbi:MAG: hypothetical protein WBV26_02190 [Candidatus Sulfotelmatobacter sp.]|jgi:hypothetical protein
MTFRLPACGLLFVAFLAVSSDCFAQNPYVGFGDAQIAIIRPEMREHMTPTEITIEESIDYHTVDTGELNAVAISRTRGGRREIRISSGLLEVFDDVGKLQALAVLWDKPGCFTSYLDYLQGLVKSNDALMTQRLPLERTKPPFPYMWSHKSVCPQLSLDVITNDERQADSLSSVVIHESIKWVLLHEFAHQLYNDSATGDLGRDREQEERADAYAFKAMLHPPEYPTVATAPILLFCSMEGFSSDDKKSDHPSAVMRLKHMADVTRSSPEWKEAFKDATPTQRKQIQDGLDALDRLAARY